MNVHVRPPIFLDVYVHLWTQRRSFTDKSLETFVAKSVISPLICEKSYMFETKRCPSTSDAVKLLFGNVTNLLKECKQNSHHAMNNRKRNARFFSLLSYNHIFAARRKLVEKKTEQEQMAQMTKPFQKHREDKT